MIAPDAPPTAALAAWRAVEQRFDRAFGATGNPLRQLGALAFLALWLLALSGIWLYVVLDTSAAGAYASIAALSRAPWSPGGLMRSLHRYAADAFVLFTALHGLREALHGRWRHFRRFSWWTGTALLPLIAVSAVGGFWLDWDRLGQFSAIATAEWLDALPLAGQPAGAQLPGRRRGRRPAVLALRLRAPGRAAAAAVRPVVPRPAHHAGGGVPAARAGPGHAGQRCWRWRWRRRWPGQGPADLATVPAVLSLDWWLLFVHPLMYATDAGVAWALVGGALAGADGAAAVARGPARRAGGGGRPGQLQRLPALLRRLPLRRDHDGAAPRRPRRPDRP